MLQDVSASDGVKVHVETRSTGRVRVSMSHAFFDVSRCELAAHEAEFLANALMRAAEILRKGAAHPQGFAGRAAADAPSPGRECVSRFECMAKGCQSGKCKAMSFESMQSGSAGYSMPGEWPKGPESFGGA